jgi:hypothetical protein
MKGNIIIRPAGSTDLARINTIYNYYVAHSACVWTTVPCSEAERCVWYEEHGGSMPVLVAESGGDVVGWGALGSFRTAYTLAGTLEDSVYVHQLLSTRDRQPASRRVDCRCPENWPSVHSCEHIGQSDTQYSAAREVRISEGCALAAGRTEVQSVVRRRLYAIAPVSQRDCGRRF